MEIIKINQGSWEYEDLRKLWCTTFGDTPEDVDDLYDMLEATGYVALNDKGKVLSALTLYEAGTWSDSGKAVYISYAICTDKAARGQGLAGRLTAAAGEDVRNAGGISILCPAEESLQDFYRKLGYENLCYCLENTITAEEIEANQFDYSDFSKEEGELFPYMGININILTPEDYGRYREEFLKDVPHVTLNDRFLEYVQDVSRNGMGMMLLNDGDAICVLGDIEDGRILLSELLVNPQLLDMSSEIHEEFAAGVLKFFSRCGFADSITYRSPGARRVQGMALAMDESDGGEKRIGYFGFPID